MSCGLRATLISLNTQLSSKSLNYIVMKVYIVWFESFGQRCNYGVYKTKEIAESIVSSLMENSTNENAGYDEFIVY